MPRNNRVNPFGDLIATEARGDLMGNRGCLHNDRGQITKQLARIEWITCLISYNGRTRQLMSPGQYTELFFLDEATALAAGQRPCGTCQRERLKEFKTKWCEAVAGRPATLKEIDQQLHRERLGAGTSLKFTLASTAGLADGSFVVHESNSQSAMLLWRKHLLTWAVEGYGGPIKPMLGRYALITPPSIIRLLAAGYRPAVHPSAKHP